MGGWVGGCASLQTQPTTARFFVSCWVEFPCQNKSTRLPPSFSGKAHLCPVFLGRPPLPSVFRGLALGRRKGPGHSTKPRLLEALRHLFGKRSGGFDGLGLGDHRQGATTKPPRKLCCWDVCPSFLEGTSFFLGGAKGSGARLSWRALIIF